MTRSKNPNPRQVTDGDGKESSGKDDDSAMNDDAIACTDVMPHPEADDDDEALRIDVGKLDVNVEGGIGWNLPSLKPDALIKLNATKLTSLYNVIENAKNNVSQEDKLELINCEIEHETNVPDNIGLGDVEVPESRTSLSFAPSSPPSFFVMGSKSRISKSAARPPPLQKMVQSNEDSDTPPKNGKPGRLKTSSPSGMLNPEIMNWLGNRFEIKPGGRISASDIIRIYSEDMKNLPDPPPTLQNYQVGQLLRRVFPTIQRCKITVNGKRVWVYRHLSLIPHDNPSSFCTRSDDGDSLANVTSKENGVHGQGSEFDEDCGVSDSPASNVDLDDEVVGDSGRKHTGLDDEAASNIEVAEGKKSNAILLGLLGRCGDIKHEMGPHTNFTGLESKEVSALQCESQEIFDRNSSASSKKKRDSEVVEWLLENYKFKQGYFVKSMDLLHRYNDGREELVKYLSQVGRVMKHVFPGVRHLRKSFRGGKREWVYLNLKPVEVDSDSEEAKSMQMFNVRQPLQPPKFEANRIAFAKVLEESPEWKHERVNITHMPLSLAQNRNAVFKPRTSIYHSVSRIDGNKLIISRSPTDPLTLDRNQISQPEDFRLDVKSGIVPHLKNMDGTRIILCKHTDREQKPDECGATSDLERDIFAPFTRMNRLGDDPAFQYVASKHGIISTEPGTFCEGGAKPTQPLTTSVRGLNSVPDKFPEAELASTARGASSPDVGSGNDSGQCASKRLRMCAVETAGCMENEISSGEERCKSAGSSVELDLNIKQEFSFENEFLVGDQGNANASSRNGLNVSKPEDCTSMSSSTPNNDGKPLKIHASPTIHYRPTDEPAHSLHLKNNQCDATPVIGIRPISFKSTSMPPDRVNRLCIRNDQTICKGLNNYVKSDGRDLKRPHGDVSTVPQDSPISWSLLLSFNAERYGWVRSPHTSWTTTKSNGMGGKKVLRFVEWFLFSGQWLINRQRALREIKIYDDWTVVIHALGRRVYPNDLGGITDLEKTSESLNKVFRVLAEARLCMGFPAPSISDLYIHGILVSKFEVWSSREDTGEDVRQRAVNCQILYSGSGACCNKCTRIMRLHHQQRRGGSGMVKRTLRNDMMDQSGSLPKLQQN